jgi:DNA replicative helicase MCM subunit Mcm2 (Cdc46/Mcm family)
LRITFTELGRWQGNQGRRVLFAKSVYHLGDPRYVIVRRANERYQVLPRILSQHPDPRKARSEFIKDLISVTPLVVKLHQVDVKLKIVLEPN